MSAGNTAYNKTEEALEEEIPEVLEAKVDERAIRLVVEEEPKSLTKSKIRQLVDGRVEQGGFERPAEERQDGRLLYELSRTQLST